MRVVDQNHPLTHEPQKPRLEEDMTRDDVEVDVDADDVGPAEVQIVPWSKAHLVRPGEAQRHLATLD